jgi:hypothetical protein
MRRRGTPHPFLLLIYCCHECSSENEHNGEVVLPHPLLLLLTHTKRKRWKERNNDGDIKS